MSETPLRDISASSPVNESCTPKRLLLVDGHYYLYRSFFAIRGLTNSKGEPTNAIYGFVKALRRMLADLKPDYAAVVWDAGLPERRTQLQPDYKQHRDEMPDDLEVQQEPIQAIVPLLGVASVFLENHEADDLIASYVTEARKEGIECVVATNDKDILQMVGDGCPSTPRPGPMWGRGTTDSNCSAFPKSEKMGGRSSPHRRCPRADGGLG